MSKIGQWIIEQEESGEIYYDEWEQRYVKAGKCTDAIGLQDEAGVPTGQHNRDAQADASGAKLLPRD